MRSPPRLSLDLAGLQLTLKTYQEDSLPLHRPSARICLREVSDFGGHASAHSLSLMSDSFAPAAQTELQEKAPLWPGGEGHASRPGDLGRLLCTPSHQNSQPLPIGP